MNMNHRLNGYDMKDPTSLNLVDAVEDMADRAKAVVTFVQNEFVNGDDSKLNDALIYDALQSVVMEILDIKKVVSHYNQTQMRREHRTDALS